MDDAEGAGIIVPNSDFYALPDWQAQSPQPPASIFAANDSVSEAYPWQILVAHEDGTGFDRVWWDGSAVKTDTQSVTPSTDGSLPWYQVAFMPVGVGVSPPTLEPGLPNWTIDLYQGSTLVASTTTDANGNYGFYNLQPGTYTVSEVQQPGWTETQPTPVPPGSYTVTLSAGQTITGLLFGNHQIPPPPPTPLPAPTGSPGSPPYFTSTAPNNATASVGQPFLYDAAAKDNDGDTNLTFDLPVHPDGMAVDPKLGVVAWQPAPDQLGLSTNVLLRVTDSEGLVALQWFTVSVTGQDYAPATTSTAPATAYLNLPYQYQLQAQDAENSTLTYSLDPSDPYGMGITNTGLITWTPQYGYGQTSVIVDVSDGPNTVSQTFSVNLTQSGTDQPPVITSTPRKTIALGQTYYYQIQANDPDGDAITGYSVSASPATDPTNTTAKQLQVNSTGLVTWTPTINDAATRSFTITVQVTDSRGTTAMQTYTLTVADVASNNPPVITSAPPVTAWVGEQYYAYNATATDSDGDPIFWKLLAAPAGMSLNANIGTVRWTPTLDQMGPQTVKLEAIDPYGGSVTQTWTINVLATNLPPNITSTPSEQATQGQLYSYAVQASDADGDPLTYTVSGFPGYQYSISSNGLLTGTPQYTGTATVTITVSDGAGNSETQPYLLVVNASTSPVNYPPVITSTAVTQGATSKAYSYQVAVTDQDNDAQTYALSVTQNGNPHSGPTISNTGLISWVTPVAGIYQVTVTVTDAGGLQDVQNYPLTVENDTVPTLAAIPSSTITADVLYRYDAQASDSDGDALTYTLSGTNLPSWLSIDQNGRISGTPPVLAYNASSYTVMATVTVTDTYGNQVSQTFTLTIAPDTQAPTLQVQLSPNPGNVGQQETLLVFATDDVSVSSLTVTENGANLDIDHAGQAFFTPTAAGTYTIVATATDAAGNTTTSTQTLTVNNPNGTPPTITLTAPVPVNGVDPNITAPTAVTGTITDDHVGISYTVTVIPYDGSPSILIGSGSTTTASSIAISGVTFDPTMLANGDYKIEIKATDTDDNLTSTFDQHVSVSGHLKLGDFTLSFTDMTIPVAGIPITITRSYDTLEAGKSSDFGYGWKLSYGDAQLEVDLVPGADIGWGGYPAFLDGTRVYVTMPGGEREGFTFKPYQSAYDSFGIVTYWHPYFVPDAGVLDTLTAPDALLTKDPDTGEYYSITDSGIDSYNPQDPNFGGTYTVTNPSGIGSTIVASTAKLLSMSDRHGHQLTFSDTGITSNTGRAVAITRDPQGRITAITDPNNQSVQYAYDANGNLISLTDRAGDPPTTFQYSASQPHYLTAIIDAAGNPQLTASFGSDGRLSELVNAAGVPLQFSYDLNQLSQTNTDPQAMDPTTGQVVSATTEIQYDTRGNLTQTTDPDAQVVKESYQNDLPTQITQVSSTGQTSTTNITYDSSGDAVTSTDANGGVNHFTYGPYGVVETASDPLGNTANLNYDTQGNLLSTVSAAGVASSYTSSSNAYLTSLTRGDSTDTFSYDSYGDLGSATDPDGVTTSYGYDNNGNLKGTQQTWTNPSNPAQTQVITTSSLYDGNDRVVAQTDEYGDTRQTTYDALGDIVDVHDVGRNTDTRSTYDKARRLVQQQNPDGTVVRTAYDSQGTPAYVSDAFVPGGSNDPPHVTRTVYDLDGREVGQQRWANVYIVLQQDTYGNYYTVAEVADGRTFDPYNLGQYSNLPSNEQPVQLSATSTEYNSLGQISQTTDAAGLVTKYTYDAAGHQTEVTEVLPNGHQIATTTSYDAAGRIRTTTDPLNHTTTTEYNGDGQVTRTIFADGTYIQDGYDANGRKVSETNQLGNTTTYEYDADGHTTAIVQPAVVDPNTGQMKQPRTEYTYDAYGRLETQKDALGQITSFTYDAYGHQTSRSLPQGQGDTSPPTETMTYDSLGRLSSHTDFAGNVTVYHYDSLDRVIETDYFQVGHNPATSPPDQQVKTQYDALGRVSQVTDSNYGTLTYGYDADNHLTSLVSPEGEVDYGYNSATGWLTSTTTANTGIDYSYDALGRLSSAHLVKSGGVDLVAAGTDQLQTYTYDDANNLTQATLDQGTTVISTATYTYDALNRLLTLVQTNGAGSQLASYTYQYDANDNTSKVVESLLQPDNTTTQTNTITYQYDTLNRLTEEKLTSTNSALNRTADYTMDLVGNQVKEVITTPSQTETITSNYDARDRLLSQSDSVNGTTSFGYDVNGNLTSRTNPDSSTVTYTFDLRGRMVQAQAKTSAGGVIYTESLTYNPDGIRTGSSLTQNGTTTINRYLIDRMNPTGYAQVLEQSNGSGTLLASYMYGLLGPISQAQGGQTNYYLMDGHSGVRQLLTTTGIVANAYLYSAYGILLFSAGSVNNPLLYRGEWFDATLGQYYLRARFYDPVTGRFGRMDPLGLAAGDTILYRYGLGNPLKYKDPSGLLDEVDLEEYMAMRADMETEVEPGIVYVLEATIRVTTATRIISWVILSGLAIGTVTVSIAVLAPELLTMLAPVPAPAPNPLPKPTATTTGHCPPEYDYWNLDWQGRATGAFAQFSAAQTFRPRSDFTGHPWWWSPQNLPLPPGVPAGNLNQFWRRGHLIASVLGGTGGTEWRNMVPLEAWTNHPLMFEVAEREARDWARAGFCIQYLAWPEYSGNNYYPDRVGIMALADGDWLFGTYIP